ncbi:DUF5017 domain-containing protein [Pontibacter sp. SGAir0037]|uniref:DUF5017 domain-containing protein n=1 Tax=Pontibacter sp. SGAir0037 TaxID=2571030 RepID=UPI0010CD0ACC|nr:DUF5017 domain-containing protein [Pontibacter sp. SGAir0037]QCR21305.1 hypothetical protein C1N53_02360 [Pontibacter sp. SGAir0037]
MKRIYITLLAALALVSCEKEIEVAAPDFDVQVEKHTYQVGEQVNFAFRGYAGNITFYSGVPGSDYNFRERTAIAGGVPQIDVTTQYGGGGTQTNSLRLMVSSNVQAMTKEGVMAASWTDITDRAAIAPNTTVTPSGTMDVSDLVETGKPLFFAFKFVGATDPDKAAGNWIIPAFNAKTLLPDGTAIPVATLQTSSWQPFSMKNDDNAWYSRGTPIVDLVIIGGGKNAPESEDWYVSKPLFFTKVPPDTGVPIQNIGSNALSSYSYVYTTPGTYMVTFLASNNSVDDHKAVVRQIEIEVTE